MTWTSKKALLTPDPHTPCQEIFQAVCDEIGKHYEAQGFKYSSSRPKIVYKDKDLKVEICFWSSRSNIPGDYVNLEILPNFYSNHTSKNKKTSGFLFDHTALFVVPLPEGNKKGKILKIFGEELENKDPDIKYSHNCNVYGIDEEKFKKIIAFIDEKIIPWISKIKTQEGILEFTENPSETRKSSLSGETGNSDFIEYVNLHFPNIDIVGRLK